MDKCAACRVGAAGDWLEVRLEHRVREGWLPPETVFSGPVCSRCEGQLLALERALWPRQRRTVRSEACDFCALPLANESWVVETQAARETTSPGHQVRMCFACLDLLHDALGGAIAFSGPWAKLAAAHRAALPAARPRSGPARTLIAAVEDGPVCIPLPSCQPPVPVRIDPALAAEAGPDEIAVLQQAMSAYGRAWLRMAPDAPSQMHRVAFEIPGNGHRYESCIARARCPECGGNSFFARQINRRQPVPGDLADLALALREANARAAWAATHDELTGLLTRPAWLAEVTRGQQATVVLFAVEHFRALNAAAGYAAADRVLQQVAALVASEAGPGAPAGRFGAGAVALAMALPLAAAQARAETIALAATRNVAAKAGGHAVTVVAAAAAIGRDSKERAAGVEAACHEAEAALARPHGAGGHAGHVPEDAEAA